jgi:hypothetical protein
LQPQRRGRPRKQESEEEEEESEEDEEYEEKFAKKPRGQITASEMGRKGQAIKQKRDRERMLAAGEISEDEPTYNTLRQGKRGAYKPSDNYDEEAHKPSRKLTAHEMGKRGQAAKQRRDRERMLAAGEISDDEPTYYAQGRQRGGGGGRKQQRYDEEEEEEDYEPKQKTITLSAGKGKSLGVVMDKARELRHQGFTIKINVERDEDEERGGRRGGRS